jgi:hypothetical protein
MNREHTIGDMRITMGEGRSAKGTDYTVVLYRGNHMSYWRGEFGLGLAHANDLYRHWLLALQSQLVAPMDEDELDGFMTMIAGQIYDKYHAYNWGKRP